MYYFAPRAGQRAGGTLIATYWVELPAMAISHDVMRAVLGEKNPPPPPIDPVRVDTRPPVWVAVFRRKAGTHSRRTRQRRRHGEAERRHSSHTHTTHTHTHTHTHTSRHKTLIRVWLHVQLSLAEPGLFDGMLATAGFGPVASEASEYPFAFGTDPELQFKIGTILVREQIDALGAGAAAREVGRAPRRLYMYVIRSFCVVGRCLSLRVCGRPSLRTSGSMRVVRRTATWWLRGTPS